MLFAGAFVEAQRAIFVLLGLLMIGTGLAFYLPRRRPRRGVGALHRRLSGALFRLSGRESGAEVAAMVGLL